MDLNYDTLAGVYRVDPKGDLEAMSRRDALRKRVIRRALTVKGQFKHLPGYGMDLPVKGPFNATKIGDIQLNVLEQVYEEDEVDTASVNAGVLGANTLFLNIVIRPTFGADFDVSLEVNDNGQLIVG